MFSLLGVHVLLKIFSYSKENRRYKKEKVKKHKFNSHDRESIQGISFYII